MMQMEAQSNTLEHYRWCCQEGLDTYAEKDTKNEREREIEKESINFRTEA